MSVLNFKPSKAEILDSIREAIVAESHAKYADVDEAYQKANAALHALEEKYQSHLEALEAKQNHSFVTKVESFIEKVGAVSTFSTTVREQDGKKVFSTTIITLKTEVDVSDAKTVKMQQEIAKLRADHKKLKEQRTFAYRAKNISREDVVRVLVQADPATKTAVDEAAKKVVGFLADLKEVPVITWEG